MDWYNVETSEIIGFINWVYRTGNSMNLPILLTEALDELENQCPLITLAYN